jgi:hypothetical protein
LHPQNEAAYYGRKRYLEQKHRQKIYAVGGDEEGKDDELDRKAFPTYSPTNGAMEAGQTKFSFANEVLFDENDPTKVLFESNLKPLDFNSLFALTPIKPQIPTPSLRALPFPAMPSPSVKESPLPDFSISSKSGKGKSVKVGVELLSTFSPGAAAALARLRTEESKEAPKEMDIASMSAFKRNAAEEVAKRRIFEHQFAHLEQFATLVAPSAIVLTDAEKELFAQTFSEGWSEVQSSHRVWNAATAIETLHLPQEDLYELWRGAAVTIKLRRGLQICLVDQTNATSNKALLEHFTEPTYLINAFMPAMKCAYTDSSTVLSFVVIEWDGSKLPWLDLLNKVVGHSQPSLAHAESIRGKIHSKWESLGLKAVPDRRDNCVHVSKSAFEGMADRLTWCKDALIFTDLFGSRLLGCNIPSLTIQNWLKNPTVQEKCIFDHMYGLAGEECLVVAERLLCKSLHAVESVTIVSCHNSDHIVYFTFCSIGREPARQSGVPAQGQGNYEIRCNFVPSRSRAQMTGLYHCNSQPPFLL